MEIVISEVWEIALLRRNILRRPPPTKTLSDLLARGATLFVPGDSSLVHSIRTSPRESVRRVYRECVEGRNGSYSGNLDQRTLAKIRYP